MGLFGSKLSDFQKAKIIHEFHTFFDLNGDGKLSWKDFEAALQRTIKLNGWRKESAKVKEAEKLFRVIWASLEIEGDNNKDHVLTCMEWLSIWEKIYDEIRKEQKEGIPRPESLPRWVTEYLKYRFDLYDRTGDGVIDKDEFEYVLGEFYVSPSVCRRAWTMITKDDTIHLDFNQFVRFSCEYYFSDDAAALGNFITGKLDFTDDIALLKILEKQDASKK